MEGRPPAGAPFRRARRELLAALHVLGKAYGLPPHLLAESTWEELRLDWEALEAGLALERRPPPRRGGKV